MTHQIGIIEGGGTGPEVAEIFRQAVRTMASGRGLSFDFCRSERMLRTYTGVRAEPYRAIASAVEADTAMMEDFLVGFHGRGGRAVFRTAVNAQSLYLLRRRLRAVKLVRLEIGAHSLLLVRDQIQGFYANDATEVGEDRVHFEGSFDRKTFHEVIACAQRAAEQQRLRDPRFVLIYKHHLFANRIEEWVGAAMPKAEIYQPDSGIHQVFDYLRSPGRDLVLVVGNEVGDILLETLILHLDMGSKETFYTRNVCLAESVRDLVVYQTMHGSADDLAGQNRLNPVATLRAAAAMLEHEFGGRGLVAHMEQAIELSRREGVLPAGLRGAIDSRRAVDLTLRSLESRLGRE